MNAFRSLPQKRRDSKCRIVIIPKKMKKVIDARVRKNLDEMLYQLAKQKGITILEGHLMRGYVRMHLNGRPKIAVASEVGYLKEKGGMVMTGKLRGRHESFNGTELKSKGGAFPR